MWIITNAQRSRLLIKINGNGLRLGGAGQKFDRLSHRLDHRLRHRSRQKRHTDSTHANHGDRKRQNNQSNTGRTSHSKAPHNASLRHLH